ncbi:ABC transporter permease [Pelagibacterium luteolum]|uniref:Spermidine/putrescine transport system permease protein n=1 Tax=Pelagibacterium luteolum TaxID=440168 RepID=A0A1G7Z901_9HYPH|nr:ABC transporter permease [Pelagibacterium luteolum]SDH04600.1 spermidine/putrescine transport system permease protein [Pelagibacterium luteolum]
MTAFFIWARRFAAYRSLTELLARSSLARLAIISALPLAWIVLANIAPLVQMFVISFYQSYPLAAGTAPEFTIRHYFAFFERPLYLSAFARSFIFATLVTALTLLVMFPVAYYIAKVAPRIRRVRLLLLVIAPFWISEIIRSFAWMLMLSNRGAVNSFLSSVGYSGPPFELLYNNISLTIGVLYLTSLYMLLPLYSALEKIDDRLLEAAADLGATSFRRFTRIILPLARDGIVTGCTLVFLLVVGLYAMPVLLGGPSNTLFASTIGQIFGRAGDSWPLGSAFSMILIFAALAYVGVFMAVLQKQPGRRS